MNEERAKRKDEEEGGKCKKVKMGEYEKGEKEGRITMKEKRREKSIKGRKEESKKN